MISIKKVLSKLANDDALTEKKTLLWTNPNPSAEFSAQTITESSSGWVSGKHLSDFDFVEIFYSSDTTSSQRRNWWQSTKTKVGKEGQLQEISFRDSGANNIQYAMARHYIVNATEIIFGKNFFRNIESSSQMTYSDSYCAPQEIYGIKLGRGGYLTNLLNLLRNKEVFA